MKKSRKNTTKRILLSGAVAVGLAVSIVPGVSIYAGSGGSPGGGDSACGSTSWSFGAVCNSENALTWVYYTFDDSNPNTPKSFNFPGNTESVGTATITGCPIGFWHLGYHVKKDATQNHNNAVDQEIISKDGDWYYRNTNNKYSRTGSINFNGNEYGQVGSRSTWYVEASNDSLSIWNPGDDIAVQNSRISGTQLREGWTSGKTVTAQHFGTQAAVEADFERAKASGITFYDDDGDPISGTLWFGQLSWFCYDDTMNTTTYSGSTRIFDGSSEKSNNDTIANIGSDSRTIKFKHYIHRDNNGSNSADNEQYYVNSDPDDYKDGSSSSPKSKNFEKNSTQTVTTKDITVSLRPGESKIIWQTLHYESDSTKNGPDAYPSGRCELIGNGYNGRYCIKLSRAPASFEGKISAKVNNVSKNDNSTTVINSDDGSYTVSFEDIIKRQNDTAGGKVQTDYTFGATINGANISNMSGSETTVALSEGGSQAVKTYDSYKYSGTLRYGETHRICGALSYIKAINASSNSRPADTITICVNVTRNPAKFTGSVDAKVNGVSKTNNSVTTISSDDGSYTVSFEDTITRQADGGGGVASSGWSTRISKNSSTLSNKNASGTVSLREGKSESVRQHSNYTYSGKLRYGETHTICNAMTYENYISVSGNTSSSSSICVKVYRENAKCAIDNNFTYGIINAKNAGRIGVVNDTLSVSKYSKTALTDSAWSDTISIYARPGDNVRFLHDMCAGSLYPIKENGLSGTVSYKASGWSSKQPTVNNSNKFLFREDVPINNNNAYNNPRTWASNTASSGKFLYDSSHVVAAFTSPSNQAGSNYRCGTPKNGWYQVAGKVDQDNNDDCARNDANYKTGILDVGSTLSQKLEWDEQPVVNSILQGGTHKREATANIIVPYNYELKPYVSLGSYIGKPAYIGETITVSPGVAVKKRKNTTVSSNNSKNEYATITKMTEVKYNYYFTDSAGNIKVNRQAARTTETRRFNRNGSLDNVNEMLSSISIEIDDSHAVGDRVCIELSVAPYDSHNGNNDAAAALKESSNGASRAISSCLSIAKRPTFSVESSNVYSATSLTASHYSKKITSDKFVFSSWSEYGVFGHVKENYLMASGAATGYGRDGYTGGKALNAERTNQSNNNVSRPSNSSTCTFMTQTFANQNCEQDESAREIGGIAANSYESRIKEHYASVGKNLVGATTVSFGGVNYLDASNIDKNNYYDASANLIGVKTDNNIYLTKTPTFASDYNGNRTIVYHAKNVVIDGESINDERNAQRANPAGVTGVIIIADNVYLTDKVKYVNATIIANTVNTCAFRSSNPSAKLEMKNLSSNVCNEKVIFDSPVVTHRLILNRTAGATNGTGSIVRAEVFNLNTGNFLWSYNQMSRYNQAITTYSRELPPRY